MEKYVSKHDVMQFLGCEMAEAQKLFNLVTTKCQTKTKQEKMVVKSRGGMVEKYTFVTRCKLSDIEAKAIELLSNETSKNINKEAWRTIQNVCEWVKGKQ